jgi:hypothetical protein
MNQEKGNNGNKNAEYHEFHVNDVNGDKNGITACI